MHKEIRHYQPLLNFEFFLITAALLATKNNEDLVDENTNTLRPLFLLYLLAVRAYFSYSLTPRES